MSLGSLSHLYFHLAIISISRIFNCQGSKAPSEFNTANTDRRARGFVCTFDEKGLRKEFVVVSLRDSREQITSDDATVFNTKFRVRWKPVCTEQSGEINPRWNIKMIISSNDRFPSWRTKERNWSSWRNNNKQSGKSSRYISKWRYLRFAAARHEGRKNNSRIIRDIRPVVWPEFNGVVRFGAFAA